MKEFCDKTYCLEVWGEYACFTRPEMKVERVSYDVITPSAARAIFEAIFWKPAISWAVRKIEILNPIAWASVRRNEIDILQNPRADGMYIEEHRQQRAGLFLSDVRYRLHAELVFIPPKKRKRSAESATGSIEEGQNEDENPGKYQGIFERRVRKGQCFNQPYFGCREFSCGFRLVDDCSKEREAIDETRDLGFMLYDLDFSSNPDSPKAAFFRARIEKGVIIVPPWESGEVHR
jgi:CRISPR-associated protein Cas5d